MRCPGSEFFLPVSATMQSSMLLRGECSGASGLQYFRCHVENHADRSGGAAVDGLDVGRFQESQISIADLRIELFAVFWSVQARLRQDHDPAKKIVQLTNRGFIHALAVDDHA